MTRRLDDMAYQLTALTRTQQLDAEKLGHMLWHADVLHYRRHGKTISMAASYLRASSGPEPYGYFETLNRLQQAGKIQMKRVRVAPRVFYTQITSLPVVNPPEFSTDERGTLNNTLDALESLTVEETCAQVCDVLWEELDNGDAIPIRAASVISRKPTAEEVAWACKQLEGTPNASPGASP